MGRRAQDEPSWVTAIREAMPGCEVTWTPGDPDWQPRRRTPAPAAAAAPVKRRQAAAPQPPPPPAEVVEDQQAALF